MGCFFLNWGFPFVNPFFTVSSLTLTETISCCFLRMVSSSCDTASFWSFSLRFCAAYIRLPFSISPLPSRGCAGEQRPQHPYPSKSLSLVSTQPSCEGHLPHWLQADVWSCLSSGGREFFTAWRGGIRDKHLSQAFEEVTLTISSLAVTHTHIYVSIYLSHPIYL